MSNTNGETLDDVARIVNGAQQAGTPAPIPVNDPFAPPRVRNQIAADMVPQLTRDAVLKLFEDAALGVERARDAMQQMMIERIAEANESAATLRELGMVQAASIERAANFAYDQATLFKNEAEKVSAFRDTMTPGANAA